MLATRRIADLIERLRGGGVGAVLARGASAFFLIHVAGVGVAFGLQVLLARALGAEPYGTYVWVYSWMILILVLCRAGLGTASLRFVAAFTAQEDWPRLKGYLRSSRLMVFLVSLLVAGCVALLVRSQGPRLGEETTRTFLVACLALPVYAVLQVGSSALRGFKRVLVSQFPSTLLQPALLAFGLWIVWARLPGSLDATTAMALNLGAATGALIFTGVALWRATPREIRAVPARIEAGAWMRVAVPLMLSNAFYVGMERIDILLVGWMRDAADAGVYAAATRVATAIAFGLVAVNAWAAPLISDLHARGDRAGLERLVRLAARGIFAFTLPLFLAVVAFGEPLLSLFGPEFARGHLALLILAGSQLVSALVGPVGLLMTMTGRHNTAVRILALHAALMLALNLVLIPLYGIVGAAVATGLTRASWKVVMAIAVWRHMRLRSTIV